MFDWFRKLFGGGGKNDAYSQLPQEKKDAVAFKAGVGAGVPGKPETYAIPVAQNILNKYVPQTPANTGVASSGYSGGGRASGGGYSQPDPASQYKNDVLGRITQLNGIYDSIFGGIDRLATDKTNQTMQSYDNELSGLNTGYAQNTAGQANAYGARGLADSSYYQNAQKDAFDVYNNNLNSLNTNRDQSLSTIGQAAATNKASVQASRNQYNNYRDRIGDYGASDLLALRSNLDNAIASAQQQQAGLGTTGDFLNTLNSITPYKQTATNDLKAKLDSLVNANAPKFAKRNIATGLITSAGADQNQWKNYFEQLLKG